MYESFLIVFRESLEMALIVGIILAYLKRAKLTRYNNAVYVGIAGGAAVSVLAAYLISVFWGEFTGVREEIFEGVVMLVAAVLLTSMIFWFFRQQRHIRAHLENAVQKFWDKWSGVGLFLVVFLAVLREGIETVLFMSAIFVNNPDPAEIAGAGFLGLFFALGLGYLIFVIGKKVNLRYFFVGSNVLLILFAAGLVAHGLHELQEAGIVPILTGEAWNTNHIVNEKGAFGGILKGLFGYNGNPSSLEVFAYAAYLAFAVGSFRLIARRKQGV